MGTGARPSPAPAAKATRRGDTDGDGPVLEGGDEDDDEELTEGDSNSGGETIDDDDKGCACRSTGAPLPFGGALLLLLIGLRRRPV